MPTQLRKMFQKVVNMAPKWAHLGAMLGVKNRLEIQKNAFGETLKKD